MDDNVLWRRRIGERIKELRELEGWSLTELQRRTKDELSKSRLSNYEQGLRMIGPGEAVLLGTVFAVSPAHILCLDDDMPALSKKEADLIRNFRALPENQREEYSDRIASLALAYRKPISDEQMRRTAYNPNKRPKAPAPKQRTVKRHDQ